MGNTACCTDLNRLGQHDTEKDKRDPQHHSQRKSEVDPNQYKQPQPQQPQPQQERSQKHQHEEPQKQQNKQPPVESKISQQELIPQIPELYPKVAETLKKNNFFEKYLKKNVEEKTFKYVDHIYRGSVSNGQLIPQGLGTLYKKDGALVIGHFHQGKLKGKGVYIFTNGSFFQGNFVNNQATCSNGYYESEYLKYKGGFKDNKFDGEGIEENANYQFQGEYSEGLKLNGTFKWKDQNGQQYEYIGGFNEREEFHGQGTLKQKRGIYKGGFVNGHKQGKGVYQGKNGIKYEGEYKKGKKDGYGVLLNKENTVTYKGEFRNGLPHGKGQAFVKSGDDSRFVEAEFVQGVDKSILQKAKEGDAQDD